MEWVFQKVPIEGSRGIQSFPLEPSLPFRSFREENMGKSFQKCHYGGHFFQVIVEDMVFDKPEQIIP
jgi:hypothetical protein